MEFVNQESDLTDLWLVVVPMVYLLTDAFVAQKLCVIFARNGGTVAAATDRVVDESDLRRLGDTPGV